MIKIGQKAPDFTLPDSNGKKVKLSSYKNKKNVVLIMYPGDDTPGCTKQLCSVRDNFEDFKYEDTVVLGINHADADSHQKFIKKYGLKNPLLVDKGRKIIKKYEAIKLFFGNESTKRSVFIIDKLGLIRYIKRGLPDHSELHKELEKIKVNAPKTQKRSK